MTTLYRERKGGPLPTRKEELANHYVDDNPSFFTIIL
jgi:hypothetical protein